MRGRGKKEEGFRQPRCVDVNYMSTSANSQQNMDIKGNTLHGEMHSLNLNFKRMKTQITLYS